MTAPRLRLALVLWSGTIGGAERFVSMLAAQWRETGVSGEIVFICGEGPLNQQLDDAEIPYRSLGFSRGAAILAHPRRFARETQLAGPDGALLVDCGYMAAALRVGGYKPRIVGVEHGPILRLQRLPAIQRWRRIAERAVGARARSVDVAVSDFVLAAMLRHPHARRLCRIYNGVEQPNAASQVARQTGSPVVVGVAARLIAGKGLPELLRAVALASARAQIRLDIAGDGPERTSLQELARTLGVESVVRFLGPVHGMPEFWSQCDIAVVPSTADESFSMTTLEAMASGLPVVASRIGGIPEVAGNAAVLVRPGDPAELAEAIIEYAGSAALRRDRGLEASDRVRRYFDLSETASAYAELFS